MQVSNQDIADYLESLYNTSKKVRFFEREQKWKAEKGDEPIPQVWTTSDCVQGLLTKEKLAEMLIARDENQMLIFSGVALVSNEKAFFFADDSLVGYKVLPPTWVSFVLNGVHNEFGPGCKYQTADDIQEQFCPGQRYIGSMEELAKYVLTGA